MYVPYLQYSTTSCNIVNLYLRIFSFVSYCNYNSDIFIFIKINFSLFTGDYLKFFSMLIIYIIYFVHNVCSYLL